MTNAVPCSLPMTSAYFRLILAGFDTTSRERARLLAGTDVQRPGDEITLGQQLRQIGNAVRVLPPDWARMVGARLHAATHGAVGWAVASAPTVRDALGVMTRYGWVRSPHFRLRVVADGDELRLAPAPQLPLPDAEGRALRDLVLLSTQGLLEAALGRPLHAARFELPEPPPRDRGRLADWFRAPIRFGRADAALVVPARWLDAPCPLADAGAFATSVERLAADRHRVDAAADWQTRVAAQLATQAGRPDPERIARRFGVSRRTLERRLAETGTTYRALADAQRRRRAELLLRDSSLGVAEIAWALGYEDAANFGRACRRWFGAAPGVQRARLRAPR